MALKFKKISSRDFRLLLSGIFCLALFIATTTPTDDDICGPTNVGTLTVVNAAEGSQWYFSMTGPESRKIFLGYNEKVSFNVKAGKYTYVAMNDNPGQGLLRPIFGEFSVVSGKTIALALTY
jgi:hypothetical protein